MKKRSLLIAFSLLLTLTFLGPAPAFAADHSPQSSQSGGASTLRADEYGLSWSPSIPHLECNGCCLGDTLVELRVIT